MLEGIILKGVGGFYTILDSDGKTYVCHARGKLRLDEQSPAVGDRVCFTYSGNEKDNYIISVFERRNLLTRPTAANLDKLMIVLALSAPKPDLLLADKLMLQCSIKNVTPVIVLNKCDEGDEALAADIERQYAPSGVDVITASARTGEGIGSIRKQIEGSICCFAGQSAVGKSSLLNAIIPGLGLETGGLSRKTERGRHTTRHAQLYPAFGGAVLDTPGFSLLEAEEIDPEQLSSHYPEMREMKRQCRFPECMHISEPGCAVKPLLETGGLSRERYERYKIIAEELKEKRKHKYD